jgi:hypothetical protein
MACPLLSLEGRYPTHEQRFPHHLVGAVLKEMASRSHDPAAWSLKLEARSSQEGGVAMGKLDSNVDGHAVWLVKRYLT